jgi:hypothetical protein
MGGDVEGPPDTRAGVEDEQPSIAQDSSAATEGEAHGPDSEEPLAASHHPSKLVWAALVLLALGALAIPFVRGDTVFADDFSTPTSLRTWADNGATLRYGDGVYEVSVLSSGSSTLAYHKLPQSLARMSITVDTGVTKGDAAIAVACVSQATETSTGTGTSLHVGDAYTFLLLPGDNYAIARQSNVISSGSIASDGSGTLHVGCALDGSGQAALTMQVGGATPVATTDAGAPEGFVGIGLGAFSKTGPATVTFDNVRVEKT